MNVKALLRLVGYQLPEWEFDEIQMKQQAATTLFIAGYDLPWQSLFKTQGSYIPLPLYPFEKQYYWYEKRIVKNINHKKAHLIYLLAKVVKRH
ncbi:hypothetical protein P3L40_04600 [Providencia sp. PROV040]|nr:hypothetical protein [Providencia sp. PROV040]WOB87179.1 hypothetical protein P3L40_04600 [Providencia sp. PROV040]